MRYTLLTFVLLVGLFLSGCSLDESAPVTKKKQESDTLALDKLEAEKATTEKQTQAQSQAPAQQKEVTSNQNQKPMTKQYPSAPAIQIDQNKKYTATLHTDKGDIVIELAAKETPITANNFVFLARDHFYDNTIFHRTIEGFMIQGGDPEGTGMGGPGYRFNDESFTGEYTRGTVAMANAGPNTNGSQFFIMHADYALPKNYVIFGHVTSGMDVVDQIATAPTTLGSDGANSKPVTPVVVKSVDITEK